MLKIEVPSGEMYNDLTNEFVTIKGQTLTLEHSLISLSKWESKWCKPFLSKEEKSNEEILDYIKAMTITQNVDPDVYTFISNENIRQINEYIEAPMTATRIRNSPQKSAKKEIITSEIIYYWMIAFNIPFECQKWHLNRLLMLIRVCEAKSAPPKKMSRQDIYKSNSALNAARRKKLGSNG